MKKFEPINWDAIPDVINKDQFYRICHISKSTALHLLQSGKVPCEYSGNKTRCYKIKKEDVKEYLKSKAVFPEIYAAPKGWYGNQYIIALSKELPEETLLRLHQYYTELLADYQDILTTSDIVKLTGYAKTTVNGWCGKKQVKYFSKSNIYYMPKVFLVDFFCSPTFRSITRKSAWHIKTLSDFQRMLKQEKIISAKGDKR